MADEDVVRDDALRLLWAMNKHKVGAQVHPSGAAHQVGLIPGESRFDAAVAHLESRGAIEPDKETWVYTIAGLRHSFYRITSHGLEMLRGYSPE
jgi:hypothetical protein